MSANDYIIEELPDGLHDGPWRNQTATGQYRLVMPPWETFILPCDRNAVFRRWEISPSCSSGDIVARIKCGMEQPFSRFARVRGSVRGKLYSVSMSDFCSSFTDVVEAHLDRTITVHDFAERLGLGPCPWVAVAQIIDKLLAGYDEFGLRVSNAFIYVEPGDSVSAPCVLWAQYRLSYPPLFDDRGGIYLRCGEGEVQIESTDSPLSAFYTTDKLSRQHDGYEYPPLMWFATPD